MLQNLFRRKCQNVDYKQKCFVEMVPELSVALLKEWVLNQMHVMKELRYNYNTTVMELFSRRR